MSFAAIWPLGVSLPDRRCSRCGGSEGEARREPTRFALAELGCKGAFTTRRSRRLWAQAPSSVPQL